MKISILTTTNSRKAGGLYTSVRNLGLSIYHKGIDVSLYSFSDAYSEQDIAAYEDLPLIIYERTNKPILQKFGYSNNLVALLNSEHPNIIHQQGIWMFPSYATLKYKNKYQDTKTIITPRGMLDPWAINNHGLSKKIIGHLYEYENLKHADCIHALCHSEYESIRLFGLHNPVAIIPNGFNLPAECEYSRIHDKKILLFIGRIHPKKGIKELIKAIALIKRNNSSLLENWEVRIAGWDQNGHIQELIKMTKELRLDNCVSFVGSVYGKDKEKELCQANAFVLTSFSEGLPMSILEAWAYKLPVLMTDQCNLPEGFEDNAAIRVSTSPESIADGLASLFSMDSSKLHQMGENGYTLVSKRFSWSHIADQTIELYKWLFGEVEKPDFVYL